MLFLLVGNASTQIAKNHSELLAITGSIDGPQITGVKRRAGVRKDGASDRLVMKGRKP